MSERRCVVVSCILFAVLQTVLVTSSAQVNPCVGDTLFELLPPYVYENNTLCTVAAGCLKLLSTETYGGDDVFGHYTYSGSLYSTPGAANVTFSKKDYDVGTIIFKTHFHNGLQGSSSGSRDGVSSGYPVMRLPTQEQAPTLRFVTPGGHMLGWSKYAQGNIWTNGKNFQDGVSGGIVGLVVPSSLGQSMCSVVISALISPMAVNNQLKSNAVHQDTTHRVRRDTEDSTAGADEQACGDEFRDDGSRSNVTYDLHWGVQGLAKNIDEDFTIEIVAVSSSSTFTESVRKWGFVLLRTHGYIKSDDTIERHLSYWTDNGAYYYHNTHNFSDYNQALEHTYEVAMNKSVPIRSMQLDSWWYYEGINSGLKNWTAMPSAFPNGIESLHESTSLPFIAHNRYFAADTDYAIQNGGRFPFTIDENTGVSLPLSKAFWTHLFADAVQWGLATYEQDWLDWQYDNVRYESEKYESVSALQSNVSLSASWLNSMSSAAEEHNLTIQYCMAYIRHALHSITLSPVTNIRVSEDYVNKDQWRIGHTSLFAYVLNLKPFKDVFWSNTDNDVFLCSDPNSTAGDGTLPVCNVDCYTGSGIEYYGDVSVTGTGIPCADWRGVYGLEGNLCRNPNEDSHPWCYSSEDHSTSVPCGTQCEKRTEPNPNLQAAIATLSTGPVAVGDKPENLQTDLIQKSCRADGLILSPSKPLTATDKYFLSDDPIELWTSEVIVFDYYFGIIFMTEVIYPLNMSPTELNLVTAFESDVLVWEVYPETALFRVYPQGSTIALPSCNGSGKFCLIYSSPLLGFTTDRVALLGDLTKWTPMSNVRFSGITVMQEVIAVDVVGVAGEEVVVSFWHESTGTVGDAVCNFVEDGTMVLLIYRFDANCQ